MLNAHLWKVDHSPLSFRKKKKKGWKRLNYMKSLVYNKPGFQFQVYHLKKMTYDITKNKVKELQTNTEMMEPN